MVLILFPTVDQIPEKLGSLQNAYDLRWMCEIVATRYGGVWTPVEEIEHAFEGAISQISRDNLGVLALLNNLVTPCLEHLLPDDQARQSLIDSWEDPRKWP